MPIRNLLPWKKEEKSIDVIRNREPDESLYAIDQWMNKLFDEPFFGLNQSMQSFTPNADLSETENEFIVSLDIPGFDEKNIDVFFQKDTLRIQGSRVEETEKKHRHFHQIERKSGSFQREFFLTDEVVEEKIEANYKNGVLTIRLPKTKTDQSKHKKILIKSN